MAILITQARFTPEGTKGTTTAPEDRVEAARRLIAEAGGTLIAYYLTSGDYDALLIFQAPSYEDAAPALANAAAKSGVADLKTVLVTSGGISRDAVKARPVAAGDRPAGAGMADLPATEPSTNVPDPRREATTGEAQANGEARTDAEAASRMLDAHKQAMSDIAAGRPAPYYLVPPPAAAPSKAVSARPPDKEDAAKKKSSAGKASAQRVRKR
ncbi:MAG TPA: GYD domain-containing protein [Burkholderiales bacterium]|nr:GYD domain-containing protein [Burkholderiales bacterium]